jgi:hypothetical protein
MTDNHPAGSPAVIVAKAHAGAEREIITLSTGIRARLTPVAASLVAEATSLIKDPDPPTWHNPDKDRDEPNPSDPVYLRTIKENQTRRSLAGLDTLILFGVELVDPLPEDDRWLKQLKLLERRGGLDLAGYDQEDPIDREFLYKKFVAVGSADLTEIGKLSGIAREAIKSAEDSFPGNAGRE